MYDYRKVQYYKVKYFTVRLLVPRRYLDYKSDLPVLQVRFGDTGTMTDNKKAQYQVGPLECYGDNFFDSVVTFRRKDANIEFPANIGGTFDMKFQFRTTNTRGIFFQAIGPEDFIMLYLYGAYLPPRTLYLI